MSTFRVFVCTGLISSFCLAAPHAPTAATKTFLQADVNRKALTERGKLVSLYNVPLATRDPQVYVTTDAFVAAFIADQANCDAMGVVGVQLQFLDQITAPTGRFSTYRYTQVMDGLPVHGSLVTLVVYHVPGVPAAIDKISKINIRLTPYPDPAFPADILLAAQVQTIVASEVAINPVYQGVTTYAPPEKVVYENEDGAIYRAWRIHASGPGAAWFFFVDAASGQIIDALDLVRDADVQGGVLGAASQGTAAFDYGSPIEIVPMPRIRVSLTGQPDTYTELDGTYSFTGLTEGSAVTVSSELVGDWVRVTNLQPCTAQLTTSCSPPGADNLFAFTEEEYVTPPAINVFLPFGYAPNLPVVPTASPLVTGQVNTYVGVTRAHDWFRTLASTFDDIDQEVLALVNNVGALAGPCRAFYTPGSIPTLNFPIDPTFSTCLSSMIPTIIYHEYGHFVLHQRISLPDGAFDEGFAAIFSALLSDSACSGEGYILGNNLAFQPCVQNIDAVDPDHPLFQNCAQTPCEVQLGDSQCGTIHCLGEAMAGAFWDLRSLIGDAATERLFADFFLITQGDLTQQVIYDVLAADDNDGNLATPSDNWDAIIMAFTTLHGWEQPNLPPQVNVRWDGPPSPSCDPEEDIDYEVFMSDQITPPQIILKSTAKCGAFVEKWFIGRPNHTNGLAQDIASVTTAWDDPQYNTDVWIGTESGKLCRNIHTVDIPAQTSTNWSSLRTDLAGSVRNFVRCDADGSGTGGRFSGLIFGGITKLIAGFQGPIKARAIGVGAGQGGVLDAGSVRLSDGLVEIPQGSTVKARTFSGNIVRLNAPLGGTLEDKDDLYERLDLKAGVATTGQIIVNGDMNGGSFAHRVTGDLAGGVEVTGNLTSRLLITRDLTGSITIHGDLTSTGAIQVNGDIGGNGPNPPYAIYITGDVAGSIIADWDADGNGWIFGNVIIGGDFSGDICDATSTMNQFYQLPDSGAVSIAGAFTGRVCPARSPLNPNALPDSALKNRMLSINPRSTNNHPVALRLDLTGMLRSVANPDLTCVPTEAFTADVTCVDHPDVDNPDLFWWVGEPIDRSCRDENGNSIPEQTCTGSLYLSRVVNTPVYRVWAEDVIHVADCEIVPVATYTIQATEDGTTFLPAEQFRTIDKPLGKHWGDVVGANTVDGWTPPNGIVNVNDIYAVIAVFEHHSNAPHKTWVDVSSSSDGQAPNGLINVADLINVVVACGGASYRNCPGRVNPGECVDVIECPGRVILLDPIPLTLSGSDSFLDPTEWLYVDVFTGAVDELGAYEVALEVSGGTAGNLILTDIIVDNTRADYVFGTASTIVAENQTEGRVGVVREGGGVAITGTKYLATFVYQPESGASGVFEIALKGDGASFLNDGNGNLLAVSLGSEEVVGVGVDCWLNWHCNDNNQCTTDACASYECVFTPASSGTSCNDNYFCTATDACNGSGQCVGTGNPCPHTQWCNEFQDQCEDFGQGEE